MSYYWKQSPDIKYEDMDTALEDIDLYLNDDYHYIDAFKVLLDEEYPWAMIRAALSGTDLGNTIVNAVEQCAEDDFVNEYLIETED